jgi:hypothetical protein
VERHEPHGVAILDDRKSGSFPAIRSYGPIEAFNSKAFKLPDSGQPEVPKPRPVAIGAWHRGSAACAASARADCLTVCQGSETAARQHHAYSAVDARHWRSWDSFGVRRVSGAGRHRTTRPRFSSSVPKFTTQLSAFRTALFVRTILRTCSQNRADRVC